jgi:hypothetical protein
VPTTTASRSTRYLQFIWNDGYAIVDVINNVPWKTAKTLRRTLESVLMKVKDFVVHMLLLMVLLPSKAATFDEVVRSQRKKKTATTAADGRYLFDIDIEQQCYKTNVRG